MIPIPALLTAGEQLHVGRVAVHPISLLARGFAQDVGGFEQLDRFSCGGGGDLKVLGDARNGDDRLRGQGVHQTHRRDGCGLVLDDAFAQFLSSGEIQPGTAIEVDVTDQFDASKKCRTWSL